MRCAMYECILLIEKDVENKAAIWRVWMAVEGELAGKSDTANVTFSFSLCSAQLVLVLIYDMCCNLCVHWLFLFGRGRGPSRIASRSLHTPNSVSLSELTSGFERYENAHVRRATGTERASVTYRFMIMPVMREIFFFFYFFCVNCFCNSQTITMQIWASSVARPTHSWPIERSNLQSFASPHTHRIPHSQTKPFDQFNFEANFFFYFGCRTDNCDARQLSRRVVRNSMSHLIFNYRRLSEPRARDELANWWLNSLSVGRCVSGARNEPNWVGPGAEHRWPCCHIQ